jgi:uncharacterized protein
LVHISQLADNFVKDPAEVVKVQQRVRVRVVEVDKARNRIALTMRSNPDEAAVGQPEKAVNKTQVRKDNRKNDNTINKAQGGSAAGPKPGNWFTQAIKKK